MTKLKTLLVAGVVTLFVGTGPALAHESQHRYDWQNGWTQQAPEIDGSQAALALGLLIAAGLIARERLARR